jgi:molybdopterin molybdotransferase
MVEQTRQGDGASAWVEVGGGPVVEGQNVMRRGTALRAGSAVLAPGHLLRPVEMGLLAEAGRTRVRVVRPPRVALIQTGDELVVADRPPGPGQIRNSNGPLLRAMAHQAGGRVDDLGIVPDDAPALLAAIRQGLSADVVILSGGVSEGDRDLVPQVLVEAGVERVFHKVHLRPGKPLWFGVRRGPERTTLVFGLPGNPVSGLVCCRLFVLPALRAMAGREDRWIWQRGTARLAEAFTLKGSRPTFWPGQSDLHAGSVRPLPWLGSADPFTLAQSDCLIFFAGPSRRYAAGEAVPVVDLDG